ncbi:MAG: cupin-like domain-containing protein [Nannocystaceae bacterium]|nr:cupin-like domain-containing protein [Nannocystaceae bacterium]
MTMSPGIAALTHPRSTEDLRGHMRAAEPFVVHNRQASLAELLSLPLLRSLDALLAAWPDPVEVFDPEVADEANSVIVGPDEARTQFASGMTLLFSEVQLHAPQLVPWLEAIRADLGVSALTEKRCLVYATPAGTGTGAHFDQNVNFVLQVHGTKRWWLAPNSNVTRPMTRHRLGQPIDPELESYSRLPMPSELPVDRTEIVLEPGSVLFVPRGTWHATHATTDALSLNFTFSAPTWLDVFGAALRSRLALSDDWREAAMPLEVATFEALLRDLSDDVVNWHAADILAVTEGEP